jgi:hypothetical protein
MKLRMLTENKTNIIDIIEIILNQVLDDLSEYDGRFEVINNGKAVSLLVVDLRGGRHLTITMRWRTSIYYYAHIPHMIFAVLDPRDPNFVTFLTNKLKKDILLSIKFMDNSIKAI